MKKIIHSSPLLVIAIAAFAFARCGAKSEEKNKAMEDAVAIKLQPVEVVAYVPVLKYSGMMASATEARLSFKTGGIISKIYVKEGDHVVKGQLLATLDLTEINAQVQQASQSVEKSTRDVNRMQNLYNDTVASLEQLQNVTTQLNVVKEGLRIAQFNRQYAQIRATTNGTVLKKLMNEGELASAGAPAFLVAGTSAGDWVVRFGVADKDWALIKKGDKATVNIDAYPDKIFTGIVTEVANGADAVSGTYEIEVKILPGGYRFAPGLFSTVQLQAAATQNVSLVPVEALAEGDGKTGFVYTLNADGRTVKKNPVTIKFIEKDKVAVNSGLENINEVITDGVGYLTDNAVVKVVK